MSIGLKLRKWNAAARVVAVSQLEAPCRSDTRGFAGKGAAQPHPALVMNETCRRDDQLRQLSKDRQESQALGSVSGRRCYCRQRWSRERVSKDRKRVVLVVETAAGGGRSSVLEEGLI